MIFSYTGVENILGQMLKVFREDGGPVPEILLVLLAVAGPAFGDPDPLPQAVLPLVFAMPFVQGLRQFRELDLVTGLHAVAMDGRAVHAGLQRQPLKDVPVGDVPIFLLGVQDVVRRH